MDGLFIEVQYKKILDKIQKYPAKLVAVSKKQPVEKIEFLFGLGQRIFAENYVQEFLEKKTQLSHFNIQWHMIGPLQSNKVNKVVGNVDLIHSVDSLDLAIKIDQVAKKMGLCQKILLQINVANEETKSGISIDEYENNKKIFFELSHIQVCGFMTMPPLAKNPLESKKFFKTLKDIQLKEKSKYDFVSELSMGTTQDYEVALDEGATLVRIGEALFGARS